MPIWHSYERSAEYYFFSCGCSQSYTTIKQLKKDLPRVKPVIMATVPRLWEAVQAGFDDVVKTLPLPVSACSGRPWPTARPTRWPVAAALIF